MARSATSVSRVEWEPLEGITSCSLDKTKSRSLISVTDIVDLDEAKPFGEKRQYQGRNGQENVPCGCMGLFQYLEEKRQGKRKEGKDKYSRYTNRISQLYVTLA